MKSRPLLLGFLACLVVRAVAVAEATPDLPKPASRSVTNLCGWTVRVDDRLLTETNSPLGKAALGLLQAKLRDIDSVVGKDRLKALKSVSIIVD